MKFLIIGLGSMGKRRIRNLQCLNFKEIFGFDLKEERRKEVKDKYGIKVFDSFKNVLKENPDFFIISTPPDKHNEYIKVAIENKKPAFIEASVILEGLEELKELAEEEGVFIAPSCTLKFHPATKEIKKIVETGKYGKVTNFSYHLGQYLPDWHPWENIRDFYVSKKETSGAREMVSFELTWLVDIVGFPKNIVGFFGKTIDMGADIDDTYVICLDLGGKYGSLVIDVVSRNYVRNLIINLERGQIIWKCDDDLIRVYEAGSKNWLEYPYSGKAANGYNKNIIEDMYIEEMKTFIDAALGRVRFPNSLDEDIKVLELLDKLEGKK